MSPTEPPISIYGTLPRSFVRAHAAGGVDYPPNDVPTHYATLRRDQLTSSRISLRQLAVMLELEEREQQRQHAEDIESAPTSPELDPAAASEEEEEGMKRKKKRRDVGVSLGRLLQGPTAMVDTPDTSSLN